MTVHESTAAPLSTAEFAAAAERRSTPESATTPDQPVTRQASDRAESEGQAALFDGTQAEQFRGRWSDIQAGFVDEPRHAVEQADELVAEVMQRLAQIFADERGSLEKAWDSGQDNDTEALRLALRRYRSFFDRLLSM